MLNSTSCTKFDSDGSAEFDSQDSLEEDSEDEESEEEEAPAARKRKAPPPPPTDVKGKGKGKAPAPAKKARRSTSQLSPDCFVETDSIFLMSRRTSSGSRVRTRHCPVVRRSSRELVDAFGCNLVSIVSLFLIPLSHLISS